MDIVPLHELDANLFRSALQVQQREETSVDPATTPITEEELRRFAVDDRTDGNRHERYAVVDGTRVRVIAHLEIEIGDENPHMATSEVFGAAEEPTAARLALGHLLDIAVDDGRTLMLGWGPNTEKSHAFWTSVGAERKLRERVSGLDVTAVDPALMATWIEQRQERAADVELVRWVDVTPDEYMDSWVVSRMAMNDAPHEDLDLNDWEVDAGDIREDEDARASLGTRLMNILGLDPQGQPVGHTSVHVNPFRPAASRQWDTVVLDAHRRRGIGRWLKAEMWQWLRDVEPTVTRLTTENAQSNDAMLAINIAMGFEPVAEYAAWQAPTDECRAALENF